MKPISIAKALIVNEKNDVLILHIGIHTQRPERSHTPDLPGGFVDEGEAEKVGVMREISEEAGITVDAAALTLVHTETFPRPQSGESVSFLIYLAKLDHTPEVKVSWEHESYEWIPIDQVATRLEMRPIHQKAIDYVIAQGLV